MVWFIKSEDGVACGLYKGPRWQSTIKRDKVSWFQLLDQFVKRRYLGLKMRFRSRLNKNIFVFGVIFLLKLNVFSSHTDCLRLFVFFSRSNCFVTLGGPGHLWVKIDLESPCCHFSEFLFGACYCFSQCLVKPDLVWAVVIVADSSVIWGLPYSRQWRLYSR